MKSLIICIGLSVVVSSANAKEVVILTDERPPFEYTAKDGTLTGVATDTVKCAMDKTEYDYKINVVPWKRAQHMVQTDSGGHGFYAASRNDARDKYAVLSEVVADQYWNWYILKDSKLDPNSEEFKKNAKVGSWYGSNSLRWIKKSGYNVVSDSRTMDLLINQLLAGRIEAAFGSNFAMNEAIEKAKAQDKIKEVKGLHKPMGVYFSKKFLKKNNGFLVSFNQAVRSCNTENSKAN